MVDAANLAPHLVGADPVITAKRKLHLQPLSIAGVRADIAVPFHLQHQDVRQLREEFHGVRLRGAVLVVVAEVGRGQRADRVVPCVQDVARQRAGAGGTGAVAVGVAEGLLEVDAAETVVVAGAGGRRSRQQNRGGDSRDHRDGRDNRRNKQDRSNRDDRHNRRDGHGGDVLHTREVSRLESREGDDRGHEDREDGQGGRGQGQGRGSKGPPHEGQEGEKEDHHGSGGLHRCVCVYIYKYVCIYVCMCLVC